MKKTLTILAFIVFIVLPVFGAGMVTSWYCTPRIIVRETIVETEVPMSIPDVQRFLGVTPDGIWGEQTERAWNNYCAVKVWPKGE